MPSTTGSTVTNQVRDAPPADAVTRAPSTSAPLAATTASAAARASSSLSGGGGRYVGVSSGQGPASMQSVTPLSGGGGRHWSGAADSGSTQGGTEVVGTAAV